jgi:hypothetical protein
VKPFSVAFNCLVTTVRSARGTKGFTFLAFSGELGVKMPGKGQPHPQKDLSSEIPGVERNSSDI